jgi:hypothetical protein
MLSLSTLDLYKHSAPTLSAVESAHSVPEEFRSSVIVGVVILLLSAKIKAKDFRRLDVIRKLEIITTIRHNNYPTFTLHHIMSNFSYYTTTDKNVPAENLSKAVEAKV